MASWGPVRPVAVGGLVAVGFIDEQRVVVGSHNGLGVIDASSGARIGMIADIEGSYPWARGDPPSATWMDPDGPRTIPMAGLWGGRLPEETADGWVCERSAAGASLRGPDGTTVAIDDDEEFRAFGFSPEGRVFVYATSPTIYVITR